jgi:hypothetical protein
VAKIRVWLKSPSDTLVGRLAVVRRLAVVEI